ncbi:DbpA RNA binding domain-containing protein [Methylomonas paludis]|uniref:DbpA RNA binding domain-containing protein n=1 Tax=Methylomonas paludis TaxID=1173101 RepID=A0A975MQM3_9GAMM|nr:DbpA RNA binding domain-containing protein [Methylomonas paludis]QWF71726.1 DbpA RNA binding domain-containing protein [Methylomonas paludis]
MVSTVPDDTEQQAAALAASLEQIIVLQNLDKQRHLIQRSAERLNISVLDCAAALLYKQQPPPVKTSNQLPVPKPAKNNYRFVRYRLDIGSQHQVAREQIQAVLISEAGVDIKRIGKIEIRHDHTLVELPDGMPADIFQLLTEASINERKLAIKRIKNKRKPVKN